MCLFTPVVSKAIISKMYKQIIIFCVLPFTLISANATFRSGGNNARDISEQVEVIREKFKNYRDVWEVSPDEMTWNPAITSNPFLNAMCENNQDGNYQIPDNCNEFCMCAGGYAYVWTCPGGGIYDPIPDECVYEAGPGQEMCPWRSIWSYPDGFACETMGQRDFWGNLTFPAVKDEICGQNVIYCANFTQVGVGQCNPGFRYSKCFLACIDENDCFRTDLDCYEPPREMKNKNK